MHQMVEQEGSTWQIARLFQHQNEEKQDQNLRQEHQHATHAGENAVIDQTVQDARWYPGGGGLTECGDAQFNAVHERLGPGEHGLENEKHDQCQPDQPENRMQQDAIKCVIASIGLGRHDHAGGEQATHLGVQVGIGGEQRWCSIRKRLIQRRREAGNAVMPYGDAFHDLHAQVGGKLGGIDADAAALGRIHHVQYQQHGFAQTLHFQHKAQMQAQVGGIGHADDQVRCRFAGLFTEADSASDGFVRAGAVQAVGARQIQHMQ